MIIVGFWGIVTKHNIIKKIFALNIINNAVVILFVLEGSRIGSNAPIMESGITHIVDPVPQALMLTAIVIGVCISALALSFAFRLYKITGTFDVREIKRQVHHEA